jgi:hypothetical protein
MTLPCLAVSFVSTRSVFGCVSQGMLHAKADQRHGRIAINKPAVVSQLEDMVPSMPK